MATLKLYYSDPALFECDCLVGSVWRSDSRRIEIILDATPFYPEGGGQPADSGTIGGQPVLAVTEEAGEVRHQLEWPEPMALPAIGSKLSCRVDAARRLDHSCQHSAQHLLSATVLRILGGPTRSFHLGEAYSSIDVDLPQFDAAAASLVEREVQAAIDDGYVLQTHVCSHEEALRLPLRRPPPETGEPLRIVEIDGFDCTPCCGTHVPNTGHLRLFRLIRSEKYKGMTRIYFLAGQRALLDYRRLAATAADSARLLGCNEADIGVFVQRLSEKLSAAEFAGTAVAGENAVLRAALLLGCEPSKIGQILPDCTLSYLDGRLVAASFGQLSLASVQRTAKACAERGSIALLFSADALTLVGAAPEASAQLGQRLKPLLVEFGAKGGGGPVSFQAAFTDLTQAGKFIEVAVNLLVG